MSILKVLNVFERNRFTAFRVTKESWESFAEKFPYLYDSDEEDPDFRRIVTDDFEVDVNIGDWIVFDRDEEDEDVKLWVHSSEEFHKRYGIMTLNESEVKIEGEINEVG